MNLENEHFLLLFVYQFDDTLKFFHFLHLLIEMVLLHVKGSDKLHEFLYQCSTKDSLEIITTNVIKIHNLRITLNALCDEMKELIQFGPMRSIELKGLSSNIIKETMPDLKMNDDEVYDFDLDPKGQRIGAPITDKSVIKTLNELIDKIQNHISIKRVSLRQKGLTKLCELESFMNDLRGALLISFPNQLPDYDILQQILMQNTPIEAADIKHSKSVRNVKTAQLWFTSKKLLRSDTLNKYIGNNEKTKIVVKITKQNGQMPMRENVVNEEMRKKMMAFWYKKQEKDKELKEEDDDNSYLQSSWADTNSLKKAFSGMDKGMQYK